MVGPTGGGCSGCRGSRIQAAPVARQDEVHQVHHKMRCITGSMAMWCRAGQCCAHQQRPAHAAALLQRQRCCRVLAGAECSRCQCGSIAAQEQEAQSGPLCHVCLTLTALAERDLYCGCVSAMCARTISTVRVSSAEALLQEAAMMAAGGRWRGGQQGWCGSRGR
jgi:hypothetical protein